MGKDAARSDGGDEAGRCRLSRVYPGGPLKAVGRVRLATEKDESPDIYRAPSARLLNLAVPVPDLPCMEDSGKLYVCCALECARVIRSAPECTEDFQACVPGRGSARMS